MSVRGYRVNEIKYEVGDTFNLWHDIDFVKALDEYGLLEQLDVDMGGIFTIGVETLEEILKNKNIKFEVRMNLLNDISWAKENNKDYLIYYCF